MNKNTWSIVTVRRDSVRITNRNNNLKIIEIIERNMNTEKSNSNSNRNCHRNELIME